MVLYPSIFFSNYIVLCRYAGAYATISAIGRETPWMDGQLNKK